MGKEQILKFAEMFRYSRYRRYLQKLARALACIVVFCTTYALILPAITVEKEYFCGYEEHFHTDFCYVEEIAQTLACGIPEYEEHTHGEACYTLGHVHEDACFDETGTLICGSEEAEPQLICGDPAPVVHTHTAACFVKETVYLLKCPIPEHIHEAASPIRKRIWKPRSSGRHLPRQS